MRPGRGAVQYGGMHSGLSCPKCCIRDPTHSGFRLSGTVVPVHAAGSFLREPPRPHNDLALVTLFTHSTASTPAARAAAVTHPTIVIADPLLLAPVVL